MMTTRNIPAPELPAEITPCCGHCIHFCNDPAAMESVFKGLTAMSSGYASVRSHDGLCNRHDFYLSYRDHCSDFALAVSRGE